MRHQGILELVGPLFARQLSLRAVLKARHASFQRALLVGSVVGHGPQQHQLELAVRNPITRRAPIEQGDA